MDSNWSMLAFEVLLTVGILAIAVRELVILRRDERHEKEKNGAGNSDEQAQ